MNIRFAQGVLVVKDDGCAMDEVLVGKVAQVVNHHSMRVCGGVLKINEGGEYPEKFSQSALLRFLCQRRMVVFGEIGPDFHRRIEQPDAAIENPGLGFDHKVPKKQTFQ